MDHQPHPTTYDVSLSHEEHIQTPVNALGTMQTVVSQTYLCCGEMWRLQAMGAAHFTIFTAVLHVPMPKEIFPTVE